MKIKTVSKSKLQDYDKCPLLAFKKLRDTKYREPEGLMLKGILAHELAQEKIAHMAGLKFFARNVEERFPLEIINEVYDITEKSNIEKYYNDLQVFGIEESVSFELNDIKEDLMISCRFDVVSYAEIDNQKFIVVDDLKSGQAVTNKTDTESIIYAFAAYEKFGGLPVIFRRLSLSSNKNFIETFSVERLEKLKPSIYFLIKKYVEDMESEMIPDYKPGNHCLYCNYISSCQGRKNVSSLQNKYKAAIWAKNYAKKYEAEVKSAAASILEHIPTTSEDIVLLPFLDGRYGAVAKTTTSWQLKGRSVKKDEIVKMLIETGEIAEYSNLIDIKFNEDISTLLSETYKIPMKEVVKTTVSLVEEAKEEEE